MPCESLPGEAERKCAQFLRSLASKGLNAIRTFPCEWSTLPEAEPMDIVGRANSSLLRRWAHFDRLAQKFGVKLLFVLFNPQVYLDRKWAERARKFYNPEELRRLPPHRRRFLEGKVLKTRSEFFKDPDALNCQREYLCDLIPKLKALKSIFAYELINEWGAGEERWIKEHLSLVRRLDPARPVGISSWGEGLFSGDPVAWVKIYGVDFVAYHNYPPRWHGHPAIPEGDYGTDVAVTARYARIGRKPAVLGEAGGELDAFYRGDRLAHKLGGRDSLWGHIVSGGAGYFSWSGHIDDLAGQIVSLVPFGSFRRRKPKVGIKVSHPLSVTRNFFSLPAGRELYRRMCKLARLCFRKGVDFDFCLHDRGYEVGVEATDEGAEEALERLQPEVEVSYGYDVQFLCSEDMRTFLCYLRNIAGTKPIWPHPAAEGHSWGYIRFRRRRRVFVRINLPLRCKWLVAYDLDAGRSSHLKFHRSNGLDLGETEHDFVLLATPEL